MRSRLGPAAALAATLLALIPSLASATGGAIAGVPQADAGALSTGDRNSCFLTATGKLRCAGDNGSGQLGDGGTATIGINFGESTSLGAITDVKQLGTAGAFHQCAIRGNGSLWCWGLNASGQLGATTSGSEQSTPVQVDLGPGRTAAQVAAGGSTTCVIRDDATLRCWGADEVGQIGAGTTSPTRLTPTAVGLPGGAGAQRVAVGEKHACAVLESTTPSLQGSLWCWGSNASGQLAANHPGASSSTPLFVSLGPGVTAWAVAAGQSHTCVITSGNQVRCAGANNAGQLGDATNTPTTQLAAAVTLGANRTAVAITAGAAFTCALLDDGSVSCWGSGANGEFGTGAATVSNTPVSVPFGGRKALAISAGWTHLCAMFDDRTTRCWGDNSFGKLAQGSTGAYGGSPLGLPAIGLGGELAGRDTDADGVRDAVDACPTTAGALANGCPAPVTPPSGGGGGGGGTTPTPTVKPELALSGRTLTFNAILKRAKKAKSCPKTAVATTGTGSSKRIKSLKSTTETVAGKVRCRITGTLTLKRKPKSGVTVRVKLTSPKLTTRTLSVKAP